MSDSVILEETVPMFFTELRALADMCDFGEQLTLALCDRLMYGIVNDRMQRRLLAKFHKDLYTIKGREYLHSYGDSQQK